MNTRTYKIKRLKSFISQTEKYNLELTEQEKEKLFNHYQKRELNQFGLMIIMKVLEKKTLTSDRHKTILAYMVKYSSMDYSGLKMKTIEDIATFVITAYKYSMVVDLPESYALEF